MSDEGTMDIDRGGERQSKNRIRRFEDLLAWQRACQLTEDVYALTRSSGLSRDYSLARQIQRAAVSVMANIAEGYERGHPGDFHRFLGIAKGSCAEVRSHLYAARSAGYIDETAFERFRSQAEEVGRIIGGLQVSVAVRRDDKTRGRRS
jgi:four helix bundle protein